MMTLLMHADRGIALAAHPNRGENPALTLRKALTFANEEFGEKSGAG